MATLRNQRRHYNFSIGRIIWLYNGGAQGLSRSLFGNGPSHEVQNFGFWFF